MRDVVAERSVCPVIVGPAAHGRDEDVRSHYGVGQANQDEGEPDQHLPPHHLLPVHHEVDADPGHQEAHVLLNQEQCGQCDQRSAQPARLQPLQCHRDQHGGERHFVEVEAERRGDRPAQRVRGGNQVGGQGGLPATAEGPPGEQPQRRYGQREQHRLGHQKGFRAAVDPVQRGECRQESATSGRRGLRNAGRTGCAAPSTRRCRDASARTTAPPGRRSPGRRTRSGRCTSANSAKTE